MRCSRATFATLIALFGCGRSAAVLGPAPAQIVPAAAHTVQPVAIEIRGDGFYLSGSHDLGEGARIDAKFRAWLGATELQQVEWIDVHTLRAVVPAGTSGNPLALTVEGPTGRGVLERAFRAAATAPASLSAAIAAPPMVEAGTSFPIALDLANAGATDALAVSPVETVAGAHPLDALPIVVPAGGAAALHFSANASGRGMSAVAFTVPGTDAFTGTQFAAATATVPVQVLAPPSLTLTPRAPAAVGVGQTFIVSVDVSNGGDVDVAALQLGVPAGVVLVGSAPAAQDVPAETTRTFAWAVRIDQNGPANLTSAGGGADAFTGAVVPAQIGWASIDVQTPAVLATSPVVQASASVGDSFPLRLVVTNQGDAPASAVQPALAISGGGVVVVAAPGPQDVPGHSARTFSWTLQAVGAGTARLDIDAAGTDSTLGAPVAASTADVVVVVQAAAALSSQLAAPAQLSTGQTFAVRLDVTNQGEATAASVAPSASCQGSGMLTATSTPAPADIPGLSSRSFLWTFTAASRGSVDCQFAARGTDANDGRTVSTAQQASLVVQNHASLRVDSFTLPARISRGQTFSASLSVTNTGEATALLVAPSTPAVSSPDGAHASTSTSIDPATLGGGESATFTWSFTEDGSGPGTLSLSATVSGHDANDPAAALSVGPVATTAATVEEPASLVVQAVALPAVLSRGQSFEAAITIVNVGQATARGVLPNPDPPQIAATGGAAAATPDFSLPVDIPGGGSATFSWSFVENGTAPGTLALSGGASGADANSGAPLAAATASSQTATVQARAALAVTGFALPAALSRGQSFVAALEVTNLGEATALQVLPSPLPPSRATTGGADATTSTSPSPVDIAGGAKATFYFAYVESGSAPGTLALSASAAGLDANDGALVSTVASASNTAAVQTPAALAITSFTVPARINRAQRFDVTAVVTNLGQATAMNVQPSPAAPVVAGSGGASASTSSVNPPVAIPGGQSATFSWSYLEDGSGPGTLSFSVAAVGADANSAAAISAAPVTSQATVKEPAEIAVTALAVPTAITRGQRFTVLETVANLGDVPATTVVPAPTVPNLAVLSGGVHASTQSAPASATIAGGSSVTFAWSYVEDGTSGGTMQFSAGAVGNDSATNDTLVAPAVSSAVITVQAPSQVVIQMFALPTTLTRGEAFTLTLVVQNVGGTDVNNFVPSPNPPAVNVTGGAHARSLTGPLPAVTLAANGGTARFEYNCVEDGTGPGSLAFATQLVGTEALSSNPISLSAPSNTAIVQLPPALQVGSFSIPAQLSRGQTFTATLVVKNAGQATAVNVLPDPLGLVLGGGAHASIVSAPSAAQSLAGGDSATFSWTLVEDGTASGTLSLQTTVRGNDANKGDPASSGLATTNAAAVQTPAALAASSLSAPATVSRGQTFTVSMTVTNTGEALAANVQAPVPSVAATGMAAATTSTALPPVQLAGGQSATFTWSFIETGTGAGTLSFSGGAMGVDANTGAPLAASAPGATTTVQKPASLAVTSFALRSASGGTSIDRGQSFSAVLTVSNTGDATALNVAPSALGPTLTVTGGASARANGSPAATNIPGGASATFTWSYLENGTAPGTIQLSAGASGTDANSGASVAAPSAASNVLAVQAPPALSIVSFTLPATLSRGQTFKAVLTVTNSGGAVANGVVPGAPALATSGGAHATIVSAPVAATVAAGASASFAWTYVEDGTSTGTIALATSVSGTDANSGAPLTTPTATTAAATVQLPAALSIALSAPDTVSQGQSFVVTAKITNTGEATAQMVAPSPNPPAELATGGASTTVPTVAAPVSIAGGTTATLSWTVVENGSGPGSLTFSAGASGQDANSGVPVSAAGASAAVQVQTPASLTVTSVVLQSAFGSSTINRGQGFNALVTVANTGQATATAVVPTAPVLTATGGAGAAASSTPSPHAVPGGQSSTYTFGFVENGSSVGTLSASAGAKGVDANSGLPVSSASVASGPLQVQTAGTLIAAFSPTGVGLRNAPFTVTLAVSNGGDAAVSSVTPALNVSGANAKIVSGPSPASATVAGHGAAWFTWSCLATSNGTVALSATATGSDVNDGGSRSASATTSTTIADVAPLASDPFGDGTTFGYVFDFAGRIYLGPRRDGRGAVRMLPDGSSREAVTFTFNADPGTGDKNIAGGGGPYPSLGFSGCVANTLDCGPDNENGRGFFGSGLISGVPWLFAGGAISNSGLDHVYMTTDTMTAPDFSYVDGSAAFGAQTRSVESVVFFHDRVYLGMPDTSVNRPRLFVLRAAPPVPGFAPSGTNLVDLQVDTIGPFGANTLLGIGANTAPTVGVDAMIAFNDRLYAANNGGILRSTDNDPQPPGLLSSSWNTVTPSSSQYTGKTTISLAKTHDIEPADKPFSQMAVLAGRLYAARKTTTGPQIWMCNPGTDALCDPGDWSLLAPNSSGDKQLSQFNNGNNKTITLLVATSAHLYVGYNNPGGVMIYRSLGTTPASRSDFEGSAGCNAGTGGCDGLGGAGLGAAATRIFDARALTYYGVDYVYVTAGNGTSGFRVFRLAP